MHEVVARVPAHVLVPALVRNVAESVDGTALCCVEADSGVVVLSGWPVAAARSVSAATIEDLVRESPHPIDVPIPGEGVLLVAPRRRVTSAHRAITGDTAAWLGVVLRAQRLRGDQIRTAARARALLDEWSAVGDRLVSVRELERRRLVSAVVTTTGREFADVRRRIAELANLTDTAAALDEVEALRGSVDDLLNTFRTVARGVHPSMLPEQGPRATIAELAAGLPRPVRMRGDLGRRVGWEVESGFYHAAAAVLGVLAAPATRAPLEIEYERVGGELRVHFRAPGWKTDTASLHAALADDAERLAVLGGRLGCVVNEDDAVVTVALTRRWEPAAASVTPTGPDSVPSRVRALVEHGWLVSSHHERWEALARSLHGLPRLAVVGPEASAVAGALVGVELPVSGPTWFVHGDKPAFEPSVVRWPSRLLAELSLLVMPEVSSGTNLQTGDLGVDAVIRAGDVSEQALRTACHARRRALTLTPVEHPWLALVAATMGEDEFRALRSPVPAAPRWLPERDLRAAVAAARGSVDLESATALMSDVSGLTGLRAAIASRVLANTEVLVARRVLADVSALIASSTDRDLQTRVERVVAGAHELAELDLVDEISQEDVVKSPQLRAEALRLLGAHGVDAGRRLDLPADAQAGELAAAAEVALARWQRLLNQPVVGGPPQRVCHAVVRSCEELVSAHRGETFLSAQV